MHLRSQLLLILTYGLLASCNSGRSEEEIFSDATSAQYLGVSIYTSEGQNTKATDNWVENNGKAKENTIKSVRFYFFNDNGESVDINPAQSYFDWNASGNNSLSSEEKIVIPVKPQTSLPTQVVALVNYTPISNVNTISELQGLVENYESNRTEDGKFVMSNSVYAKSGNAVIGTSINGKFYGSVDKAKQDPVTVHVDRILARMDIHFAETLTRIKEKVYDTGIKFKEGETEKPVYIKLLGWGVTSAPSKSRLVKSINSGWNENLFGSKNWNNEATFRSYWAINPEEDKMDYQWYSFTDLTGKKIDGTDTDKKEGCYGFNVTSLYMQENANRLTSGAVEFASPKNPSALIIAGQLIDDKDNPLEIAEYESEQFTIDGFKDKIAQELELYTVNDGANGKRKISPADLTFETSMQHKNQTAGPGLEGTYYSYIVLTSEAKVKTWYYSIEENAEVVTDPQAYINSRITEPAKVWNEGYTYFFRKIPHVLAQGSYPEYLGVVRNTFYDVTINGFTKLGTPVYDPSEKIYPEQPEEGENMLKTEIRVVEWRLAEQTFQFNW